MSSGFLLFQHAPTDPFVWHKGKPITAAAFLHDVMVLVESLPERRYLFNLCENRYHFMVGFAAATIKGQVNLLPPNRTPDLINGLAAVYTDSYCLSEQTIAGVELPSARLRIETAGQGHVDQIPAIDGEQLIAIAFTSGSTGVPKPNPKQWKELVVGADSAISRFNIVAGKVSALVATVPPQHMYGLETSLLIPWQAGVAVHTGRPFFPADVAEALASVPKPRILITTPLHLRACLKADLTWPELGFIISATAPLSADLAQQVEERLDTQVMEIFGCTEAGSIASRRTTEGGCWHLYDGMSLRLSGQTGYVESEQLPQPVPLGDQIEVVDRQHFSLLGRNEEMINIAGKRACLSDLNHKLNAIAGVEDGAFIMPDSLGVKTTRLAAFVVAPTLDEATVTQRLKCGIDAAFLPRPLYKVDALPRNETGKLPRAALLKLLEQHKGNQ
ncbi:MAG: AMP-binding protein [Candidatus Polarisedimenticolaceae bacterium]|nr:AMP-binding protein [Candidatus Polarisedimenticolaceae bacterium]